MKNFFTTRTFIIAFAFIVAGKATHAADRYWVHRPFYENFFSSAAEPVFDNNSMIQSLHLIK
ncbi:MAG TPA: hypothetical protein VHM26_15335 [Chitinophagaceae bacterium]|jgi:hypothetical protein|nr:hypothetical protein [Chitinophagaceae bacterium]